ncbi:7226_t:CDS:2, partial [Cetraspora pellucida]
KNTEQEFDQTEELPKCLLCKKNHWRCKGEKYIQCYKLALCNDINYLNCKEQKIEYQYSFSRNQEEYDSFGNILTRKQLDELDSGSFIFEKHRFMVGSLDDVINKINNARLDDINRKTKLHNESIRTGKSETTKKLVQALTKLLNNELYENKSCNKARDNQYINEYYNQELKFIIKTIKEYQLDDMQLFIERRFDVKFEEDLDIEEVKNYVYDDDFENLYKDDENIYLKYQVDMNWILEGIICDINYEENSFGVYNKYWEANLSNNIIIPKNINVLHKKLQEKIKIYLKYQS